MYTLLKNVVQKILYTSIYQIEQDLHSRIWVAIAFYNSNQVDALLDVQILHQKLSSQRGKNIQILFTPVQIYFILGFYDSYFI